MDIQLTNSHQRLLKNITDFLALKKLHTVLEALIVYRLKHCDLPSQQYPYLFPLGRNSFYYACFRINLSVNKFRYHRS